MRFEALVFDRDDGLAKNGSEIVVVDDDTALQREGTDDAAVAIVEIGRRGWAIALEVLDLGKVNGVDEHGTGKRAGDDGE